MFVKLNNKVRYRHEDGWIYLCDLRTLRDYEIPLEYDGLLNRMTHGVRRAECSDAENDVIEDFVALGLTTDAAVSPAIWEALEFE
jgi:hypothetical protein